LNPLRVPKVTEAACLGAAMLAAVGVGAYPDLKVAAKAAVQFDQRVEPNPRLQKAYQGRYAVYRRLYPQLIGLAPFVSRL
jgi:xylulokinase